MAVPQTGVWKRGLTLAQILGMAPCDAIDSVVRAPGRMVVSVDAVAEVRTTAMSSLSNVEPSTADPSGLRMSPEFLPRYAGPWNACAAVVVST